MPVGHRACKGRTITTISETGVRAGHYKHSVHSSEILTHHQFIHTDLLIHYANINTAQH